MILVPGVCIWKAKLSIILCYTLNGFMLFKRIQYLPSVIACVGWTWIITRDHLLLPFFPSFMCSSFDHHSNNHCLFRFHLCTFFCHHSIQALWSIWSSFDSVSFYSQFSIDMSTIGAVFKKIFTELKVEPADYWVWVPVKGATELLHSYWIYHQLVWIL